MLTSMGTNSVDQFIPSQHLSLITQPVLGARSRSKNRPKRLSAEKDKWDTHTLQQNSTSNSASSTFSSNRLEFSSNTKRSNTTSHHESSDSGIDLSLSTSSSIAVHQHAQSHMIVHRPLSALDEDSSADEAFSNEKQRSSHLRFPPIVFGRNRSMEDMLGHSGGERQEQHRSSSFTEDRPERFPRDKDKQIKRSSDGVLLDLQERRFLSRNSTYKTFQRYPNEQHDLTNRTSRPVLSIYQEANISSEFNHLPRGTTIHRTPHSLTVKPSRKKPKSSPLNEQPIASTSSRLQGHDQQQMNSLVYVLSNVNSSNQTTPRSRRLLNQTSTIKQKASAIHNFPGQSTDEANNRNSFQQRIQLDRQQPIPLTIHPRPGVLQQVLPFDASPSKVNNLLLRHQFNQQPSPTTTNNHSNFVSQNQNLPTGANRHGKSIFPLLLAEEPGNLSQVEQRKFRSTLRNEKSQERDRKRSIKVHDESLFSPKNQSKNPTTDQIIEPINGPRKYLSSNVSPTRQQEQNNQFRSNLRTKLFSTEFQPESSSRAVEVRQKFADKKSRTVETIHPELKVSSSVIRLSKGPTNNETRFNSRQIDPFNQQQRSEQIGNVSTELKIPRTTNRPSKLVLQQNNRNQAIHLEFSRPLINNLNVMPNKQRFESTTNPGSKLSSNSIEEFQRRSPNSPKAINDRRVEQFAVQLSASSSSSSSDRRSSAGKKETSKTYRLSQTKDEIQTDRQETFSQRKMFDLSDEQRRSKVSLELSRCFPFRSDSTNERMSDDSSRRTFPFVCTPSFDDGDGHRVEQIRPKTPDFTMFTLSDREQTWTSSLQNEQKLLFFDEFDGQEKRRSPIVDASSDIENREETRSDDDQNDGWSDDSFEVLYVDEKYLSQKRFNATRTHLNQQRI